MIKKILLASIVLLGIFSCNSNKIPKDVMDPNEMKTVLWDLLAAGELKMSDTSATVRMHLKDSTTALFSHVLKIHNMSKDTFMHSYKYYEAHPDKQYDLIDTLASYTDRQLKIDEACYHLEDSLHRAKADTTKPKSLVTTPMRVKIDSLRTLVDSQPAPFIKRVKNRKRPKVK